MRRALRYHYIRYYALGIIALIFAGGPGVAMNDDPDWIGYGVTATGLFPHYLDDSCPRLTSLYASMIDVDGSRRDEPHSGVDGGKLNDWILAPGPGIVKAAWHGDWGWGPEGALLIVHKSEELGLGNEPEFYYSEFDHLRYDQIKRFKAGDRIERGQPLARVFRPGGKLKYLEEVHWEVWAIKDDAALKWRHNQLGGRFWVNPTGQLIDPLFMLSRNKPPNEDGSVDIVPFEPGKDYKNFRGFTFHLACKKNMLRTK
jgi:hypothetical protein